MTAEFGVVVVGAGPLGRQTILELDRWCTDHNEEFPATLLIDNGDIFSKRVTPSGKMAGKRRWTSAGLSLQTVANLRATGLHFIDGVNATVRIGADPNQLPTENHDAVTQIPAELTPKLLQVTFPQLLETYDPLLAAIADRTNGRLQIVRGEVLGNTDLVDARSGWEFTVRTSDGDMPIRCSGVLYGADGTNSIVRDMLGITLSRPLHDLTIRETAAGYLRTDADEPQPGFVTVDWFNTENEPGPGGSVLFKTDHPLHILTTRQIPGAHGGWAPALERAQHIARVAAAHGLPRAPDQRALFKTAYRRVDDPVRLAGSSGAVAAVGGEAAVSTPPLGGFGVNLMISTWAHAAARMIHRVLSAADVTDRIAGCVEYRNTIENAAGIHHSNTLPKYRRFAGLEPIEGLYEQHYRKSAIALPAYFPGGIPHRAQPDNVLRCI